MHVSSRGISTFTAFNGCELDNRAGDTLQHLDVDSFHGVLQDNPECKQRTFVRACSTYRSADYPGIKVPPDSPVPVRCNHVRPMMFDDEFRPSRPRNPNVHKDPPHIKRTTDIPSPPA